MQSMAKEVWYFTQVSGTEKGGRFKNADLARVRILITFPTCHPQWSSEPQAHHKQVTLQKWRPGTPGKTRPITWRNTSTISIQTGETKINTARKGSRESGSKKCKKQENSAQFLKNKHARAAKKAQKSKEVQKSNAPNVRKASKSNLLPGFAELLCS